MAVGGGGAGGMGAAVQAGKAYVTASLNDGPLKSGLLAAKKMVLGWGAGIAAGGAGLLGIGTAITAPILASFREVLGHFDQFSKAADRTGATTEALSALAYAAQQSDASLEDVQGGVKFLQKNLVAAAEGSKEAAEGFAKLGLTADDLKGKSLDDQFAMIADGLAGIEDPAERTSAAIAVLGKGGLALVPMLKDGGAALRQLLAEAGDVGAIVKDEDARNATRIGDAFDRSFTAAKNAVRQFGAALLPEVETIEKFSSVVTLGLKDFREFVRENQQAVVAVLSVGAALMVAGGAFIGIGTGLAVAAIAVSGFLAATAALGTVLAFVFSPVGLGLATVAVAGVMVAALVAEFVGLERIAKSASLAFSFLGVTFKQTWAGIQDAIVAGDFGLAFKIAVAGLDVVWQKFLVGLTVGWNLFMQGFTDGWHKSLLEMQKAGIDLTTTMAIAMAEAMRQIANAVGDPEAAMKFGGLIGMIDKLRKGKKELADAEFARDQGNRNRDRLNAPNGLAAGLAKATEALRELEQQARAAANTKLFADLMRDLNGPVNLPRAKGALNAIGDATAGTFSTFGRGGDIFAGAGGALGQIRDNTKDAADALDEIKDKVGPAKFN